MVTLTQRQIERFRREARKTVRGAIISLEKYERSFADARRERDFFNEQLGLRLRVMRRIDGVSLRALAKKLKLSPSYVSDVELGRRAINDRLLGWLKARCAR